MGVSVIGGNRLSGGEGHHIVTALVVPGKRETLVAREFGKL
jgi:hypothetical protein